MSQIGFNPYITTVGNAGMFSATSVGGRQGTAYADPSSVFRLRGGILAASETLPMWGGVAIYEDVPASGVGSPSPTLGVTVGRANGLTGSKALAGFSVFDQNFAGVTTPQSPVPLNYPGGQVNSYALGSKARIWVKADPALVNLRGGPIGANVSWDWVNQLLIPYVGTLTISSGTYNNTSGLVTLTMSASVGFSAGDAIVVSGLTGTGAFTSLDGTFTALSASGTTVTYNPGAGLGAATITGGSLTLGSGASVALPCSVLELVSSNCETVNYDPVTGFATWSFNDCAAVIQI
jgi:hypothetical protein